MLRKIFDLDNGFMRGLSRSTDLIVLNVLFLVCSLLVVTFGASLSALYSMTLKMVRNEEDYTVRGFFKAFRENLKQGMIFGVAVLVILATVILNIKLIGDINTGIALGIKIICFAISIWLFLMALYVFPIIARFRMKLGAIYKNAFLICVTNFKKTLILLAMYIPVFFLMFYSEITMYLLLSICIVCGFAVMAYCQSFVLRRVFDKYEPAEAEIENIELENYEELHMNKKVEGLKGKLIVSCQALPHEPLHSSFIMGRMAVAAKEGGALGIRANTKEDIAEIKSLVELPVIGIVKRDYEDCKVYITPTMKEIEELMEVRPEIIAVDATGALRPEGKTLEEFFKEVKAKYPNQLFMADCSTVEEALHADELGFDFIGTTMVGYTEQSAVLKIEDDDFAIIREILSKAKHPVIAEGNINTPEKVKRVIELGCFSVVVGSIITRPQLITKAFADALK